jgi:hypothetical protein
MNVLIDIAHPAQVHLLKGVYESLIQKGFRVYVTVKDLPAAKGLLQQYQIPFFCMGAKKNSLVGKFLYQGRYTLQLLQLARKYTIDLCIGSSLTITHLKVISGIPALVFDDDDDAVEPLFAKLAHPFASVVLTPSSIERKTKNAVYYAGYHELAYLYPGRFKRDVAVLKELGIHPDEPFFILRFNAFKAHHDVGAKGLSFEQKQQLVALLLKYGRVFISTEGDMEPEFTPYKLPVSPDKIHSVLSYATIFIGDSQTMTTEAALLGTPAVKLNSFAGKLSVPNELEEKYHLCYSYTPSQFDSFMQKIQTLLADSSIKQTWKIRRDALLAEKIDVSSFFLWFIENYPSSVAVMRRTPEFQFTFR